MAKDELCGMHSTSGQSEDLELCLERGFREVSQNLHYFASSMTASLLLKYQVVNFRMIKRRTKAMSGL